MQRRQIATSYQLIKATLFQVLYINTLDYEAKMNNLLSDANIYELLKRHPTSGFKRKFIDDLQKLLKELIIDISTTGFTQETPWNGTGMVASGLASHLFIKASSALGLEDTVILMRQTVPLGS